MDYMKMWMKAKRKLMEISDGHEPVEVGNFQIYSSEAEAVLRIFGQIEMEEFFGEEIDE